ncbi:MAG: 1,4-dihydroxy-2-naphthoate octaprenyltransferase [Flavobacteriales bacterium]
MKWIKAARLRTLPLSLAGIIMGGGLSFYSSFNSVVFWLCIATAIAFQVLSNFANDYGDFAKGTDNEDRIGPKRTMQAGLISKKEMKIALVITSILSLALGGYLSYLGTQLMETKFFILFLVLGILSVVAAIKYTVGKRAYGYSGLGDLFVFIFFGLVGVLGSKFLISGSFQGLDILPAFSIGMFSMAVLNLNNMRDEHNDKANSKNTLVVKMGLKKAKIYHYILILDGMALLAIHTYLTFESYWQWLFLFPFLILFKHLFFVKKTTENKTLDPELKKVALSTFFISNLYFLGIFLSC